MGMGGVGGDDGVFQTEVAQKERGLDDFAAFLRDAALGEDEALAGEPEVDDGAGAFAMGGAGAPAAAAPDFAVDRKMAELGRAVIGGERGDFQPGAPVAQGVFELAGIGDGGQVVRKPAQRGGGIK